MLSYRQIFSRHCFRQPRRISVFRLCIRVCTQGRCSRVAWRQYASRPFAVVCRVFPDIVRLLAVWVWWLRESASTYVSTWWLWCLLIWLFWLLPCLRMLGSELDREWRTTRTALFCFRIVDDTETGSYKLFVIVNRCAVYILQGLLINDYFRTVFFDKSKITNIFLKFELRIQIAWESSCRTTHEQLSKWMWKSGKHCPNKQLTCRLDWSVDPKETCIRNQSNHQIVHSRVDVCLHRTVSASWTT